MNDLDLCLEVVSRSCQPLRHFRHWISRKPLEIETWFQRTTDRKRPMASRLATWPMTSRDPQKVKLVTPIRLEPNISKTAVYQQSLKYCIVCCEASRSAILATVGFLFSRVLSSYSTLLLNISVDVDLRLRWRQPLVRWRHRRLQRRRELTTATARRAMITTSSLSRWEKPINDSTHLDSGIRVMLLFQR